MPELSQTENNHPQANPQSFFAIVSGGVAQTGISFAVVPDTTKVKDLYWGQILHLKSLPKLELPDISEYVLTQLGVFHATSLIHILDEAVYYPKVQSHIMSIIAPYIEAHREVVFDMPPTTPSEAVGNSAGDEKTEPETTDVRNMSIFRFLDELKDRTYKPNDTEDEE
jgi:hypothetical protein